MQFERQVVNHWAMTTALIFGAAGGIGRAVSTALQAAGTRVLGVCRDETRVKGIEAISADLSQDHQVAEACLWAALEAGSIDVLV